MYLKLIGPQKAAWAGRKQFFLAAADAMRRILIDHARRKHRVRHGGGRKRVDLDDLDDSEMVAGGAGADELLSLDDALTALAERAPRKARVVELRFFGGLSVDETAEVLGVSPITVMREWKSAKAWLYRELTGPTTNGQ